MAIVRLGVGALAVAWAAAIWAQERPPMEFAPEEVTRADAGVADAAPSEVAPPTSAAPQEEDREAAPIVKGGAAPKTPAAATAPTSAAKPTPLPTPKVEKSKRGRAPKPAAPPAPPPPPAVPPRLTAHVYEPERANRFEPEEAIEAALDEVLAADTRLRYTPLAALLEPPDAVQKALADADKALADAKQAYADMDLDKAKQLLQTALKGYQSHLPELAARPDTVAPMRDGFLELSKVRFFEGNLDGARDAIRYALVLDGTVKFSKIFPQQMKKLVTEARLLYETLGAGKLTIDSDPPGAAVWLNGIKMPDRTPTQSIDAPPGPNFISYARRGYAPMTLAFEVAGGGEEAHALTTLQRRPKNPLGPIDRARAHIEDSPAPKSLKEACAQLGVDMLILVRTSRPGEKEDEQPAVVTGYLYDARPNRIINRIEMKVETDLPTTARVLARELLQGVRLDGIWEPPAVAKRPPWSQRAWAGMKEDWGRFRRWKGFWYVVGGVAGVAVIGAVAGGVAGANARNVAADTVLLGGH